MEDYAIVPHTPSTGSPVDLAGCSEPIAEQNFNRKKVITLEHGIGKLQKSARQQHEVVAQLENDMKTMISEVDLRRAIGLAFQEFENRLEDAFQDSNRKCLTMFSKRDEVADLQGLINKKVNWTEYNTVLKKISELRAYLDTMADSIFIGHREALNGEFAKKADTSMVDQALKSKADVEEVSEVRNRLEQLEILVSNMDARHQTMLDELRDETDDKLSRLADKHQVTIDENRAGVRSLRESHASLATQLRGVEEGISVLTQDSKKLREAQQVLQKTQDTKIMPTISSMQERLGKMDEGARRTQQDLQALAGDTKAFREASQQQFSTLTNQAHTTKEQLEFLMQATEMMKRSSRETKKANATKFKELTEESEKVQLQLSALERQLKRQERDVKVIENRSSKAYGDDGPLGGVFGSAMRALAPPPEATPIDGNDRLKGVLDQLEMIAGGAPLPPQLPGPGPGSGAYPGYGGAYGGSGGGYGAGGLGDTAEPQSARGRPPLPNSDGNQSSRDDSSDMPRYAGQSGPAPIDASRALPMTSATVRGMYGLSPRAPGAGAKTVKKKR